MPIVLANPCSTHFMNHFIHIIKASAARRALPVLRVLACVAWAKMAVAALLEGDKR